MRILIVDDSPTPRLILRRELEGLGHECLAAEDGNQALETFRVSAPDVIVSDWMMPGMDGDELCRQVRSDPGAPYVYFILLTSLDDPASVIKGMEAGADDHLAKSFERDDLQTRLIAAERVTGLHQRLAAQQVELERLNAILQQDSRRDHLTGLGNRLRQDEDLAVLAGRAQRYGHGFSVVLFDVDRFKAYNDTAGHPAGDDVLRAVAGSWPSSAGAETPSTAMAGRNCSRCCPRRTSRERRSPPSGCARPWRRSRSRIRDTRPAS